MAPVNGKPRFLALGCLFSNREAGRRDHRKERRGKIDTTQDLCRITEPTIGTARMRDA
jgi:hypothetical protein